MVRAVGLEPTRLNREILSLLRLPFRHARVYYIRMICLLVLINGQMHWICGNHPI